MSNIGRMVAVVLMVVPTVGLARDGKPGPPSARGDQASWFPKDSYPIDAKRRGEHGKVGVKLTLDEAGIPTACAIVSSSNSKALDEGTCKIAMANARFNPARDQSGKPIPSSYTLRIVDWK